MNANGFINLRITKMKKISIEHNFGGGWRIEVPIRDMSAVIAEAIQDSDTLLSVDSVVMKYDGLPSVIYAKGDSRYERELKDIIREFANK